MRSSALGSTFSSSDASSSSSRPARCGRSHGTAVNWTACVTSWKAIQVSSSSGSASRRTAADGDVRRDEQQPRRRERVDDDELELAQHALREVAGQRARLGRQQRARRRARGAAQERPRGRRRARRRPARRSPIGSSSAPIELTFAAIQSGRCTASGTGSAVARPQPRVRHDAQLGVGADRDEIAGQRAAGPRGAADAVPRETALAIRWVSARSSTPSIMANRARSAGRAGSGAALRRRSRAAARARPASARRRRASAARGPAARRAASSNAGKATSPPASRTMSCAAAMSTARVRQSVSIPSARVGRDLAAGDRDRAERAHAVHVLERGPPSPAPCTAGRRTRS